MRLYREDGTAVDWRCALSDALLSVNTASHRVVEDFERLIADRAYDDEAPALEQQQSREDA